jgi:hypothetical protein
LLLIESYWFLWRKGKRKRGDTLRIDTTFRVNYSSIPSYYYNTNYDIKLKLSHHSCVYPPPGFSNSGTARYPLDFNV